MKYKPGDEVLVKGAITDLHEGTDHPYFVAVNYDSVHWVSEEKIIPMDKTYEVGLNDAWELAKKIGAPIEFGGISNAELYKLFGTHSICGVFGEKTYEEALAKIEAYEKEKEIKVGDVVENNINQKKYLVIGETNEDGWDFVAFDIDEMDVTKIVGSSYYFKKTGKHIDIESLLRQIGE